MARIYVPRRAYSQPQGRLLLSDLGMSLSPASLLVPSGDTYCDVAAGLSVTAGSGGRVITPARHGLARTYSAAADHLLDGGRFDPRNGYSWLLFGEFTALATWAGFFSRTSDNGTTQGLAWQRNSSGDALSLYHGGSSAISTGVSIAALLDGTARCLIGSWTPRGGGRAYFVNSGAGVSDFGITVAPAFTAGQGQMKIGASRNVDGLSGRVYLAGMFPYIELADAERLSAHPWRLFRSEPEHIYSAQINPATQALSAASFAGRIPSVTVTY